ncbi:NifB/NifX family molybdenum-iron cluster-binding protein [Lachnoclostridium sp. An138]|uniref:NifB/NifX family molybdenum-iron cluster-binding protein n=1 Tax=Lachnoclostridium sp. An138 TaxID=1965560 RepID=UPI000B372253|nr:NifB/NifX family molybdenum-iron cluster-binding protein [Lachnoclostridium sp. An138]OUQ18297.1 peptidylprolyl isomerase [Lachnoclostridium sp. An138]
MKIAVTYDNGNVFQHFGKTEFFKVYEVEDNKVVSSEVIGSNGVGHGALAGLLADQAVDVLICGGIGGGAQAALEEAGVELCAGAEGDTDQAVEAYLRGELISSGANCDHHHHEEGHSCGGHEEGHSCGGCGESCGGGCGQPALTGRNVGKTCRTHYRGTFNDGTQFDSSYDRGEPLEFICGAGQMIRGFDAAVADMEVGQVVDVHLMPEEAYGMPDPNAIFTLEIAQLPGSENLEAGQQVYLSNQYGQPFPVKVAAKDETTITFDANHEMAGKELNFRIDEYYGAAEPPVRCGVSHLSGLTKPPIDSYSA